MFIDKVKVTIQAGRGGNGKLSFRHEKYVDRGGPDGGDGGNGGDIYAVASNNQNTLASFRYMKSISSEPGLSGDKRKKHGKKGPDYMLNLPVGTVIVNSDGVTMADLTKNGEKVLIAKGGHGGFGNAHFISSTRQAPRIAEKGEPGEEFEASFELKMIADVGLIGLPNAGKSTLLSIISNARPEIADYPFTTLRPNLGVVDIDESSSALFADIPGLIEGASQGKGLGVEFLRHVERTKLLIHLVDAYSDDIVKSYKTILGELSKYAVDLSKRPQIVAISKIEGLDSEIVDEQITTLKKVVKRGTKVVGISAKSNQGIKELLYETKKLLEKSQIKKVKIEKSTLPIIQLDETEDSWKVDKQKDVFVVTGVKIERFANKTDFDSYDGTSRLKDIMRKMGIMHDLERKKIKPNDQIVFGKQINDKLRY